MNTDLGYLLIVIIRLKALDSSVAYFFKTDRSRSGWNSLELSRCVADVDVNCIQNWHLQRRNFTGTDNVRNDVDTASIWFRRCRWLHGPTTANTMRWKLLINASNGIAIYKPRVEDTITNSSWHPEPKSDKNLDVPCSHNIIAEDYYYYRSYVLPLRADFQ